MHQDFKELSSAFNAGQVRYLIVGGYAVSFHAQQRAVSTATSARSELDQIKKEGREEWLRQREQKGSSPTLEENRAKGREDWLKLRSQHTRENSRDPQDRSAERDQEAKPKDLSESPDKGLDDDLN
jgi:hypothetical protein